MAGKPTTPSENLSISQPAEATTSPAPQMVDISRIQPYEHNPRHGRNPEYDRIRDSIRNTGLDQPLVVTQRPDATDFIVHAGGNTRLIILKELFAETGDPRFAAVPCLLKAWCCESDVLLAHLRENDLRGGLTFIDKARAVCEAQKLLAEELGLDVISQRRLETELRRAGYRITQARISQMVYTVHRLLPVIPIALEGGIGRPHVERIRRLERAAHKIWQDRCSESAEDFEEVFTTLCKRYDSPDWDTDVLRSALESEIAAALDVSIHTVRVMLDAEMAGRELVIPEAE
jgi:ParB family protein of integrating conjugative element (PFGI_1 class)